MRGGRSKSLRWMLAFMLATSHVLVTGGTGQAGVENYLDQFDARSYSNSDGSKVWTGPWEEVGEPTDPLAGSWQVVEDTGYSQYALVKEGAAGISVQRVADLDGFGNAALRFEYRRYFLPSGKSVEVQVSSNGTAGPWTTVHTISGVSPPKTDDSYIPVTVDISEYISDQTAVRFDHSTGSLGTPMALFFDNVEIVGNMTNTAPVLSPVGDISADEATLIEFTATATDPDPNDTLTFSLEGPTPDGAAITPNGSFTWTPSETQGPGHHTITIQVADNGNPTLTDSQTITITVDEANNPPQVTNPGNQANGEADNVTLTIDATDPDLPANTLTWSASGLPPGLDIHQATGRITGTVDYSAADTSPYSVQVTANDGNQDASTMFQWTIANTNRAPVLSPVGDISADEATLIEFTATATDPDPNDTLTFSLEGPTPDGAAITPNGNFTWTPSETQGPGHHTITIQVADNGNPTLTDSQTITITVDEANNPPIARDDAYSVVYGETLAIDATGVLTNDDDADSHQLTVWLVGSPAGGLLELDDDGSFVYSHTAESDEDDHFTYRVSDGFGGTATATVTIRVLPPPNRPPVAGADAVHLAEDTDVLLDVLANDGDPDGDDVTVTSVRSLHGGGATMEGTGEVRFTPRQDFYGTGRAEYTISDGNGGWATAEVTFIVTPVNDAPLAAPDRVTLDRYVPRLIPVLGNDSDPDGDYLRIVAVDLPNPGEVEIDGEAIVYMPPKGWVGTTSFSYVVADEAGAQSEAMITVEMPPQTLAAAQRLSNDLGTADLQSEWIEASFDPRVNLALSPFMGLQLFVKAFFQSLDGIQLSLALLGLTAMVLAGFSLVSRLPMVVPFGSPRYWATVLVGRESQLEVHEKPSRSSQVIYQLRPTTKGVESEPARRLMPRGWIPVETPRGQGWAETANLTEQVDAQSFMEDSRPPLLVQRLAARLRQGRDISRLVGRRGLIVDLGNGLEVIEPQSVAKLRRRGSHLPGVPFRGEFRSAVANPFLEAYEASGPITAGSSHSASVLLPTEVLNFWYLTVGGESDTWLVLFEYHRDNPRIVGLLRDE